MADAGAKPQRPVAATDKVALKDAPNVERRRVHVGSPHYPGKESPAPGEGDARAPKRRTVEGS
jgi:hypothetical protein